jgi:hypothetical protein
MKVLSGGDFARLVGNRPLKTGLLRHLSKSAEISAEELE